MSKKLPLTVIINTKNSAVTLEKALQSVDSIASQIVVLDMMSQDKTTQIAKKFTSNVYTASKDFDYVEPARNEAINKATEQWVLILDADEEISESLQAQIVKTIEKAKEDQVAFYLPRQNEIFGKIMSDTGWWPDYQLRLFRKGTVSWSDQIHSSPMIEGNAEYFEAKPECSILHHNFQSVSQFIERLNRYTSIEANLKSKSTFNESQILSEFQSEFLRRLFQEHGIDEGVHGVSLSLLQSMYQLATVIKVWENSGFPINKANQSQTILELRNFQKDLNYWIADWQIKHSGGISKILWQIRRKFKV